MPKAIKIMLWNANGIQKHKKEIELILQTEHIDVCLISETHLTRHSTFCIDNYDTYHTIHPMNCARGGSAILVRKNIKHHESHKISRDEFQVTSIEIETDGIPLCLSALYSPPRHRINRDLYLKQSVNDSF